MNPEEKSWGGIDQKLRAADWIIQKYKDIDLSAGYDIAVRKFPLREGSVSVYADYVLYVGGKPVGAIETTPA